MRAFRRSTVAAALSATSLLLCLAGSRAVFCSGLSGDAAAAVSAAQRFYTRVLGDWVGTTVSRVNGAEPTMGYFHVIVTRVDENTFREEYTFYRIHPKTGVLQRSGIQSLLATIENSGVVHEVCRGTGTVLIDLEPKNQSFEATGAAQFTGPGRLQAELTGKIAVDGMPLNLGKNGKLRKATAAWSLEEDALTGQMRAETSFRALFITRRYCFETQFHARRGANVQIVAGRAPNP